jgi:hypothetical protein
LPNNTNSYNEIKENRHKVLEKNKYRKIQYLINKLEYIYLLTAKKYIKLDQENENFIILLSE